MEIFEKSLIEQASANMQKAYAPYSGYKVGAALLASSSKVYDGANIEGMVYRATHAEKLALDCAVMAGERQFIAIAVVTNDPIPAFPCGQCLQDLAEFDNGGKGYLEIIAANPEGKIRRSTLAQLLPERFTVYDL
ncbi:MAG: cytidine deaminase [Nanoarchaeota archaeon]|nr:cytidine deaminase [Nanoarchaeota archaeon]